MTYSHVTGGVVSGSGKRVTAVTAGLHLKACGLRVTPIKIDPYLNTNAGTMPPFEHGGYVDLDRGNCKRFLHIKLTRDNYITGKIYQHVIAKKRDGDYLGKTVQGWRCHVGDTTHLGSRKSFFNAKDSKSEKLYDAKNFVDERHRHRYEVNPDIVERQEKADLSLAAKDEIMKVWFKVLSLE